MRTLWLICDTLDVKPRTVGAVRRVVVRRGDSAGHGKSKKKKKNTHL